MAQRVKLPNGVNLDFPDEMQDSEIESAIFEEYPEFAPQKPSMLSKASSAIGAISDFFAEPKNNTPKAGSSVDMPISSTFTEPPKKSTFGSILGVQPSKNGISTVTDRAAAIGLERAVAPKSKGVENPYTMDETSRFLKGSTSPRIVDQRAITLLPEESLANATEASSRLDQKRQQEAYQRQQDKLNSLRALAMSDTPEGINARKIMDQEAADTARPALEAADMGDSRRGVAVAARQLPQLGYGLVGATGAIGESAFGQGGIFSDIKNFGVKEFDKRGKALGGLSKKSDSLTYSLEQANKGDYGSLVDWLQYGIGYGGMQAATALIGAGIGGAVGKASLKGMADSVASGMVAKEVAAISSANTGRAISQDAVKKMAVSNVAQKLGIYAGVGVQSFGMEGGEIGGELASKSAARGTPLTSEEIAKGLGATIAAGSLEFVGDKLGLDIAIGKSKLLGAAGAKGATARAGAGAAAAIPVEAGTEYFQTGVEEFGKGNESNILPWNQSEEAQKQAFDAAGLGAVGGGAIGAIGGLASSPSIQDNQAGTINTDQQTQQPPQQPSSRAELSKLLSDPRSMAEISAAQDAEQRQSINNAINIANQRSAMASAQPSGDFATSSQYFDLAAQEKSNQQRQAEELASLQAMQQESALESADARVLGAQQRQARLNRLGLLDAVYSDQNERAPAMAFLAALESNYPNNPNPTPEEKAIIAKRESAFQAFNRQPEPQPITAQPEQNVIEELVVRSSDEQRAQVDQYLSNGFKPINGARFLANGKGKKLKLTQQQREYVIGKSKKPTQQGVDSNTQTVRSDAGQVRAWSTEGQQEIQRSPIESGGNIQQQAQEQPRQQQETTRIGVEQDIRVADPIAPIPKTKQKARRENSDLIGRIKQLGGINSSYRNDIVSDAPANVRMAFGKNGTSPDDMVSMLEQSGFVFKAEDGNPINQLREAVQRYVGGERAFKQGQVEKSAEQKVRSSQSVELENHAKELGINIANLDDAEIESAVRDAEDALELARFNTEDLSDDAIEVLGELIGDENADIDFDIPFDEPMPQSMAEIDAFFGYEAKDEQTDNTEIKGTTTQGAGASDEDSGGSGAQQANQETTKPKRTTKEITTNIDRLMKEAGIDTSAPKNKSTELYAKADKLMKEASAMLDGIQPGQPILSTRDSNLREKSMEKARKAKDLYDQADKLKDESQVNQAHDSSTYLANTEELDAQKIKAGYAHRAIGALSDKVAMERDWYVKAVQKFYDTLLPLAKNPVQKTELENLTRAFRDEYRTKRYHVLSVGEGAYSVGTAGRENFNYKQAQKRSDSLDNAEAAFLAWVGRSEDIARNEILNLRTTQEKTEDSAKNESARVKRLIRDVVQDFAVIGGIDEGTERGMSRPSFVNAAVRKIAKLHQDNETAALKEVFDIIGKWDGTHKKPLFTKVSSVWKYQGNAKPSAIDNKIAKDGTRLPPPEIKDFAKSNFKSEGADGDALNDAERLLRSLATDTKQREDDILLGNGKFAPFSSVVNLAIRGIESEAFKPWPAQIQMNLDISFAGVDRVLTEALKVIASKNGTPSSKKTNAGNADKPAKYTLETQENLFKRVHDGTATAAEFKESFTKLLNSKAEITAELAALTKDEIFRQFPYTKYRYKNEKKADVVDAVYSGMITQFVLGDVLSYSMGKNAMENAVQRLVDATTDESIAKYSASIKKDKNERDEKRKEILEGIEDPKTLEDYNRLIGVRKSEIGGEATFAQARMTLTPEQRETYDNLAAEAFETVRAKNKVAKQEQSIVSAGEGIESTDIIKTKHTKQGHDLYQFDLVQRVSKEQFYELAAQAKKLGGNYSSYRVGGAIPGWQFRTEESAKAFKALVSGDASQAKEVVQERRNAYTDDRSQTAVERLNEMANKLDEEADESLNQVRKANTHRRAAHAASADSAARKQKALAGTMRNIAKSIDNGSSKRLKGVRQKIQVEMLRDMINGANGEYLYERYKSSSEVDNHRYDPISKEAADYIKYPSYTAYRSTLAELARKLIEIEGSKKLGQQILKYADDVSDAYVKFVKSKLDTFTMFTKSGGAIATFTTKDNAEASIAKSGFKGKAIAIQIKRGEYLIVISPSEAIKTGLWKGDNETLLTLTPEVGEELVAKFGQATKKDKGIYIPWHFENTHKNRKRLLAMGIETPAELRAAAREFIGLQDTLAEESKVKKLERAMVGRANDGLDFFPTPASVADEMIQTADIKDGMRVLEPSAGMGHIADRIREVASIEPDVIELSGNRRELLEAKGYQLVGSDFMDISLDAENQYDRIIMNPPFGDRRDALHVMHAYNLLKPGGRIVAIIGEGVFFGKDAKANKFREWLDSVGGTDEKLAQGSFMDSSLSVTTGTNARMVVIDKPEGKPAMFSRDDATESKEKPLPQHHTQESAQAAIIASFTGKQHEAIKGMFESGKAKVISTKEAAEIIGESVLGSNAQAFYNQSDKTSYFIHDAIPTYTTDSELRGLVLHEIAVHAMNLGKDSAEFKSILKQVETLRESKNKAVIDAFSSVPDDTPSKYATEEALAYLVQSNPDLTVVQRFIAWFRDAVRGIGKLFHPVRRAKWFGWADTLTVGDLVYMANMALESATPKSSSDSSLMFSIKKIIGDSGRQYTPEQLDAMEKTGSIITEKSFMEKIKELKKDAGKRMAQGIADTFRPVRDLDEHAYALMRLSKGATGAIEAFMKHGKLFLRDDIYDATNDGGVIDIVFTPIGKETTDFLRWVAGNRAERLSADDRESLFTNTEIEAFKSLADGDTKFDYTLADGSVTRNREAIYKDTLTKFNAFNKNALDMAEQSGLIDPESRKLWEHEFYVPFYRVAEDDEADGVRGMNIKSGVVRQKAFEYLKGGDEKLNDLLANTLMNWSHLIDASAKNRAAKETIEAAFIHGAAIPAKAGDKKTVWYMDGGEKAYFTITDPYLMTALEGLEYAGMHNAVMDAMTLSKHLLTVGVTVSPFFKIKNLIRDSVHSIAVSELSYNPAANLVKGYKLTDRATQDYVSALAGGGLIRFGTMLEGSEAARTRQLIKQGSKDFHILDDETKVQKFYDKVIEPVWSAYAELGSRGEEINRAALYNGLISKGVSHAEASLMARDLMDFSMQGSWTIIRFLTQIVPFMNARIQGMYKLGRAYPEDKARFHTVLSAVTALSLAALALGYDDEEWKKREDWDRDNYWWFRIAGIAVRIPKPFEIGAIATLAERSAELIFDKEMTGRRFLTTVKNNVLHQLSMDLVPQLFKPIYDLNTGVDSFTGREIESGNMDRIDKDWRFNKDTSMVARGIGTAGNSIPLMHNKFLSPMQVDHLIKAYFAWIGTFVLGFTDIVINSINNEPTKPAIDRLKKYTGGMVSELDGSRSRYVSQMYEQAKEIEMAHNTWRDLIKKGKREEAKDYLVEHRSEIVRYRSVENVKKLVSESNERIRKIERDKNFSAQEKRRRITLERNKQHNQAVKLAPK